MKKICIVTTIELTIESFFKKQCIYLGNNGFDITVVCSDCNTIIGQMPDNIKCKSIEISRGIKPTTLLESIKELTEFFEKEKFDLVQYSTPNAAFVASIAAKKANVPVRNYHLMGFRYLGESGILRFILKLLEKITCRLSTHIECVSKSNLDLGIKERIFKPEKAVVIWNGSTGGVNLKRFNNLRRAKWRKQIRNELALDDNDFVFGFVGRITLDKGINEILQAFNSTDNDSKLLFVGAQEGIKTLDQTLYQSSLHNDRIIYIDKVDDIVLVIEKLF